MDPVGPDRIHQGSHDGSLSHDVGELRRSPFSGENYVRSQGFSPTLGSLKWAQTTLRQWGEQGLKRQNNAIDLAHGAKIFFEQRLH